MNKPLKKNTRIALMVSGGTDALLGVLLLLIGFGVLPVDVTGMGFENWHVLLAGALVFLFGVVVFTYNLSRIEE